MDRVLCRLWWVFVGVAQYKYYNYNYKFHSTIWIESSTKLLKFTLHWKDCLGWERNRTLKRRQSVNQTRKYLFVQSRGSQKVVMWLIQNKHTYLGCNWTSHIRIVLHLSTSQYSLQIVTLNFFAFLPVVVVVQPSLFAAMYSSEAQNASYTGGGCESLSPTSQRQ